MPTSKIDAATRFGTTSAITVRLTEYGRLRSLACSASIICDSRIRCCRFCTSNRSSTRLAKSSLRLISSIGRLQFRTRPWLCRAIDSISRCAPRANSGVPVRCSRTGPRTVYPPCPRARSSIADIIASYSLRLATIAPLASSIVFGSAFLTASTNCSFSQSGYLTPSASFSMNAATSRLRSASCSLRSSSSRFCSTSSTSSVSLSPHRSRSICSVGAGDRFLCSSTRRRTASTGLSSGPMPSASRRAFSWRSLSSAFCASRISFRISAARLSNAPLSRKSCRISSGSIVRLSLRSRMLSIPPFGSDGSRTKSYPVMCSSVTSSTLSPPSRTTLLSPHARWDTPTWTPPAINARTSCPLLVSSKRPSRITWSPGRSACSHLITVSSRFGRPVALSDGCSASPKSCFNRPCPALSWRCPCSSCNAVCSTAFG